MGDGAFRVVHIIKFSVLIRTPQGGGRFALCVRMNVSMNGHRFFVRDQYILSVTILIRQLRIRLSENRRVS